MFKSRLFEPMAFAIYMNIQIVPLMIVAVKRFCHLSLRENVTILFLNKLTSCIVIYRRCF